MVRQDGVTLTLFSTLHIPHHPKAYFFVNDIDLKENAKVHYDILEVENKFLKSMMTV